MGGWLMKFFAMMPWRKKVEKTLRRLRDFHIQAWSYKDPYWKLHIRTNKLIFFQFILPYTSFFLSANLIIYFSFNKVKHTYFAVIFSADNLFEVSLSRHLSTISGMTP